MLTERIAAGGGIELHLVMTKFGQPEVTVRYEVAVESL